MRYWLQVSVLHLGAIWCSCSMTRDIAHNSAYLSAWMLSLDQHAWVSRSRQFDNTILTPHNVNSNKGHIMQQLTCNVTWLIIYLTIGADRPYNLDIMWTCMHKLPVSVYTRSPMKEFYPFHTLPLRSQATELPFLLAVPNVKESHFHWLQIRPAAALM